MTLQHPSNLRSGKAAGETGLLTAAEHHWASVVVLLEGIQQGAGKAKVALHKLLLVLRAVHARQIEHKVGIAAPLVQLLGSRIQIVLKDSVNLQLREPPVLAIGNILQRPTEVLANEPLGSCYKYLHYIVIALLPCLIFTLFYSLSLIGPFYPSSYLLLPSFYPKAYHYVICNG